jgi:hypothetical protein
VKQGIIMEVNDRFLTLLTPEGEFLKARNQNSHYQIGQEISFVPVEKESFFNGWSKVINKKTAGILVAASFLLLFSFLPSKVDNEVYAYMSIDGESSIELAVNKDLEVIDVIAYNDSGEEVIADIEWENEQVDKVSSEIISSIDNQAVNSETQEIVVGTVLADTQKQETDKKLHQVIDSLKEETVIEISDVQATPKERKEAKEKGVTVGKYKSQQAKEKVKKEKKEESVKEEETPVETPAPSVIVPNNHTTNPSNTNNGNGNGNGNANPNAQKEETNKQQIPSNSQSNQNNPGHQKNEIKKTEKQHANAVKKQEKNNNGNKEEKPRK